MTEVIRIIATDERRMKRSENSVLGKIRVKRGLRKI